MNNKFFLPAFSLLLTASPVLAATTTVNGLPFDDETLVDDSGQYNFSAPYVVTIEGLVGTSTSTVFTQLTRQLTSLQRSLCRNGELLIESLELNTGIVGNNTTGAGTTSAAGLNLRRVTMGGNVQATVVCRTRSTTTTGNSSTTNNSANSSANSSVPSSGTTTTGTSTGTTTTTGTSTGITSANAGLQNSAPASAGVFGSSVSNTTSISNGTTPNGLVTNDGTSLNGSVTGLTGTSGSTGSSNNGFSSTQGNSSSTTSNTNPGSSFDSFFSSNLTNR